MFVQSGREGLNINVEVHKHGLNEAGGMHVGAYTDTGRDSSKVEICI